MYQYNNVIVAGIYTAEEFTNWLSNGKPETGYIFKRKLDNLDMGHIIHLGMDYSEVQYGLAKEPRKDDPSYYYEEKVVIEEETPNLQPNLDD